MDNKLSVIAERCRCERYLLVSTTTQGGDIKSKMWNALMMRRDFRASFQTNAVQL